jgi:hypothetical protein
MLQEVHEISVSTQEILLYTASKRFVMLQVCMKFSGTELLFSTSTKREISSCCNFMKSLLVQKNSCSTPPRDLEAHENSGICMGIQKKNPFTTSHNKLREPPSLHDATSHWLHGNSIPKFGCHYFWPGLIALPKHSTLLNFFCFILISCGCLTSSTFFLIFFLVQ